MPKFSYRECIYNTKTDKYAGIRQGERALIHRYVLLYFLLLNSESNHLAELQLGPCNPYHRYRDERLICLKHSSLLTTISQEIYVGNNGKILE